MIQSLRLGCEEICVAGEKNKTNKKKALNGTVVMHPPAVFQQVELQRMKQQAKCVLG